jgi:hypothetical protein
MMGDVLSAVVVYVGTSLLGMSVSGFAAGNIMLTLVWIGVPLLILRQHGMLARIARDRFTAVAAGLALMLLVCASERRPTDGWSGSNGCPGRQL